MFSGKAEKNSLLSKVCKNDCPNSDATASDILLLSNHLIPDGVENCLIFTGFWRCLLHDHENR